MSNKRLIAGFEGITAFFLWSTLTVFFNIVSLPISVYVVFGSLIGLLFLYGYFYIKNRRLPKFSWSAPLVVLFLVAAIKGVVWFKALTIYPVADALILHNLAPLITVIFAPLFIKEKPRINHLIAIISGLIGLILLLRFDHAGQSIIALGAIFSLIAAACSALQNIVQRRLIQTMSSMEQAFIFVLGQALGSVLFLPGFHMPIQWITLKEIIFFGIFGTAIPIILLSRSYRFLKSFEVGTLGYTEPLFGALWGSFFLSQPIEPATVIGGFLIFLSGIAVLRE